MTSPPSWFSDDDKLLAELGAAVRASADVPERFLAAGKAAIAWRTVDADLARLLHDSLRDPDPAGMREPATAAGRRTVRGLSFAAGEVRVELEIHPDAVHGQIIPPGTGTVLVRDDAGAVRTVAVDEVGWFVFAPVPAGRVRLLVRPDDADAVVTEWISLYPA